MKWKWIGVLASVLLFCASLFGQPKAVKVPFEFYKNELVAEVMVDGKGPFMMMLDTGTDPSAIDIATARAAGIKVSGKGRAGSGGGTQNNLAYECKLKDVKLGGLDAGTIDAVAIDLSTVSERMGKHIDGVIGYSLFKNRIVQFDYPHSVLRFFEVSPSHSPVATTVKFRYVDNVIIDDVWVNGIKAIANLDTGSSGTLQLSPKAMTRFGLADAAAKGTVHTSVGYNGAFENHEGKLQSFKIGDILVSNVDVLYFPAGTGHDKVPWDVNIGNLFLKDYVVTVDFFKKTVTFGH